MKKEFAIFSIIAGIIISLQTACNTNNATSTTDKNKDTLNANNQGSASNNSDADLLPSLLEIGATIKNSGLTYIPGLTNPITDVSKYSTAYDQYLNLGIYFADLSYCTLNKQNQQSTNYVEAVKAISNEIGIGQIFGSNAFSQRYQANLDNEDSLTAIVADLQVKVDDLLKVNLQNKMRVVIYSGAWVENMFIGAKVTDKSKNINTGFQIVEQMTMLDNMLKVLDEYKSSDQNLQNLYADLKQVSDTYHSFDEAKNYNPDSKLPFTLTDEHSKKLTELLEALHKKYIK
jgi:hypothetical protein